MVARQTLNVPKIEEHALTGETWPFWRVDKHKSPRADRKFSDGQLLLTSFRRNGLYPVPDGERWRGASAESRGTAQPRRESEALSASRALTPSFGPSPQCRRERSPHGRRRQGRAQSGRLRPKRRRPVHLVQKQLSHRIRTRSPEPPSRPLVLAPRLASTRQSAAPLAAPPVGSCSARYNQRHSTRLPATASCAGASSSVERGVLPRAG